MNFVLLTESSDVHVFIFVLLRKTSVDKPLLEYMSKNTIQDNVQCTRVDRSQEH